MKHHLVLVEWDDTITHHGWKEYKDIEIAPEPCLSVGWVLKSDKKSLTLSAMKSKDGCAERQIIPRGCIRSIRKLDV